MRFVFKGLKMVPEMGCGLDSSGLGYFSVLSSCEHGNKRYTEGGELLDRLSKKF
jgi:hypothetical protein